MSDRPVPCAGVVCLRGDEVLLVRRGQAPSPGQWSIPGGRVELGETVAAAALRELKEETGVEADLLGLIDVVDHFGESTHLVLVDYAARWTSGEPAAGDDAAEAGFFTLGKALTLVEWDETRRIIRAAVDRFG